ncbi:MAG: STAS domain-containing protein [Isosphaeraceae bacterium]
MSAPVQKHLRVTDVDGVAVVDFVDSGLMYEAALVQQIGDELESLLRDQGKTRLLLDFSSVQYLSSTMLAQLAKLQKDVQAAKGQLKLIGLGPVLRDTFRIGHFDSLFAIYDDRTAALKAFR